MGHVAKNIPTDHSIHVGVRRYRRLQIFSLIDKINRFSWMRVSEEGRALWSKLSGWEKIWAAAITILRKKNKVRRIRKKISQTSFIALEKRVAVGDFARLPEVYDMLSAKQISA